MEKKEVMYVCPKAKECKNNCIKYQRHDVPHKRTGWCQVYENCPPCIPRTKKNSSKYLQLEVPKYQGSPIDCGED